MKVRLATVAALSLALISAPADALKVKKKNESWGKSGVTFAQYRADALECSNVTYRAPITFHPIGPVPTGFGGALPLGYWLDISANHVPVYTTTLAEMVRHATWMDVVEQLQVALDQCLTGKGYTRFRLTSEQMERLSRLKQGSPQRQQYLYMLGTNSGVVATQKI
jgi:hypothetical protein